MTLGQDINRLQGIISHDQEFSYDSGYITSELEYCVSVWVLYLLVQGFANVCRYVVILLGCILLYKQARYPDSQEY